LPFSDFGNPISSTVLNSNLETPGLDILGFLKNDSGLPAHSASGPSANRTEAMTLLSSIYQAPLALDGLSASDPTSSSCVEPSHLEAS
jgi:hypothetical protein